jgi:LacI family transcriptional regulator
MKAMSDLAFLPNRPSAVICSNDMTAIGVMRQAFELSLDIPQDLSVVGFDDIRLAQFLIPPLTTVQMSQTEIAETAFTALLEFVQGECRQTSQGAAVIQTKLVLRRSTAMAHGRRMKAEAGSGQETTGDSSRDRSESATISG